MGCYLEEYRGWVGTWAPRLSRQSSVGHVETRKGKILMGSMMLCAMVLVLLLMIGGVQLNPGPVDNIVQVLCSGCDRILKLGTQCESCGWWYHNSCGNVKFQVAESGKWNCNRCRSERIGVLEEKLRDAHMQTEELQLRNKALEEQLHLMVNGKDTEKGGTAMGKSGGEKCLVLGDSIARDVGAGRSNMRVECCPGIRTDQLQRVMENRDLGCANMVVIHVGINDVRRFRNLDYIMEETYDLVNMVKTKFLNSRLVLSGMLRCRGLNWRYVGAMNDILEWVARNLGATLIDPSSWIRDGDFGKDVLHLYRNGTRQLGDLYSRVCKINSESRKGLNNRQHVVGSEFNVWIPDRFRKEATQEYSKLSLEVVEAGRFAEMEMMDIGGKKGKSGTSDKSHTMVSTSK